MISKDIMVGTQVWYRVPNYIRVSEATIVAHATDDDCAVKYVTYNYETRNNEPTVVLAKNKNLYLTKTEAFADAIIDGLDSVFKSIEALRSLQAELASARVESTDKAIARE